MSDREILIRCEHASKKFCRNLKQSLWYGIQDMTSDLLRRRNYDDLRDQEFWAVDDVSFELRRGEFLGLIGRNGAGKTTLLKMLNGLIKPDRGEIEITGRVGALIALGAGFNPILTGRENIYVNASILGLRRAEVRDKFDEIVAFAELEEFIDSPVQSYSSGMQVRLGFAIAAVLIQPDVLLLDEVLAVGDGRFRVKCYEMVSRLREHSCIVLVSHSMQHIGQFCNVGMFMHQGAVKALSPDVTNVIDEYNRVLYQETGESDGTYAVTHEPVIAADITFNRSTIRTGEKLSVRFHLEVSEAVGVVYPRVTVLSPDDRPVLEWNSIHYGTSVSLRKGTNDFEMDIGSVPLRAGRYYLQTTVTDKTAMKGLVDFRKTDHLDVTGSSIGASECQLPYALASLHGDASRGVVQIQ